MSENPLNQKMYEHISEDSDLVASFKKRTLENNRNLESSSPFGIESFERSLKLLEDIEGLFEKTKSLGGDTEELSSMIENGKLLLVKKFNILWKETPPENFTILLMEIIASNDLLKKLKEIAPDLFTDNPNEDLIGVARIIFEDRLSFDLFREILVRRISNFRKAESDFNNNLEKMLWTARDKFILQVQEGVMPISEEKLKVRLKKLTVSLVDFFFSGETVAGTHNPTSGQIEISYDLKHESIEHTIIHEIAHAVSGKTILLTQSSEPGFESLLNYQRNGLRFNTQSGRILDWLNEAVTERITEGITGKTNFSYIKEKAMLDRLIESGVSWGTIKSAYFEDYDPDSPERVPAWKKFSEEVRKAYPGMSVIEALEKIEKDFPKEDEKN